MLDALSTFLYNLRIEKGQDAAEYALLIALIAIVIIVAVTLLGTNISLVFSSIAAELGP